jgi:hypothetical protein
VLRSSGGACVDRGGRGQMTSSCSFPLTGGGIYKRDLQEISILADTHMEIVLLRGHGSFVSSCCSSTSARLSPDLDFICYLTKQVTKGAAWRLRP